MIKVLLLFAFYTLAVDGQLVTVSTPVGQLTGKVNEQNVTTFLGVPFAHPPVNEMRFQMPKTPFKWQGVWQATKYANACIQASPLSKLRDGQVESEDCLHLDIYVDGQKVPPNSKLPVVIFIHGGGFTMGTSALYDYSHFVTKRNIVAVSIQYRLGLLGFAKTPDDETIAGNLGLHDQVAAIKWVKKYIKYFGGDADKITLQGESAGSGSIGFHMFSPLMKDTFNQAIMESGAPGRLMDKGLIENSTKELLNFVNCSGKEDAFKCLRSSPVDLLKQFQDHSTAKGVAFVPTLDTHYFAGKEPSDMQKEGNFTTKVKSIVIGHNGNEGAAILPFILPNWFPVDRHPLKPVLFKSEMKRKVPSLAKRLQPLMKALINLTFEDREVMSTSDVANKMGQLWGDIVFACPQKEFSEALLKSTPESKLFYYHFRTRSRAERKMYLPYIKETLHGGELQFAFGRPFFLPGEYTEGEKKLSKLVMDDWAEFVKSGQVKSKKWLPSRWQGGKVNFNHASFIESDLIVFNGFPTNLCSVLPRHSTLLPE